MKCLGIISAILTDIALQCSRGYYSKCAHCNNRTSICGPMSPHKGHKEKKTRLEVILQPEMKSCQFPVLPWFHLVVEIHSMAIEADFNFITGRYVIFVLPYNCPRGKMPFHFKHLIQPDFVVFVCFPRQLFATHPFFSVAKIPTPLNQDCFLITRFTLLNPPYSLLKTTWLRMRKRPKNQNNGNGASCLAHIWKWKASFSIIHSYTPGMLHLF